MNDFHASRDINIKDSNVTVNNSSTEIKPIFLLTTSELFEEQKHREELRQEAEQKRIKHLPKLIVFAGACMAVSWGLQKFSDLAHPFFLAVSALSAIASLGSFYIAAKTWSEKSEFELRQLEVLKEIKMILKERRAL